MRNAKWISLAVTIAVSGASAQLMPLEFPPDGVPLSEPALKEKLTKFAYKVTLTDGSWWRLQFRDNGQVFVNTNTGARVTGAWRVEGSTVCTEIGRTPPSCSEARLAGDTLYVKRTVAPGEVLKYQPN